MFLRANNWTDGRTDGRTAPYHNTVSKDGRIKNKLLCKEAEINFLMLCLWACPCDPDGQMTMTLHVYRPRRFQWNWFTINPLNGCWIPASASFQESLLHLWACPCGPDGQMTMMLHICRPRWFQWTWFGVNQPSGCWIAASIKFGPDEWTETIP